MNIHWFQDRVCGSGDYFLFPFFSFLFFLANIFNPVVAKDQIQPKFNGRVFALINVD